MGYIVLFQHFRSMSYSDNKGNILPQTVLEALMEKLHLKHGVYHTIRKTLTYFFPVSGEKAKPTYLKHTWKMAFKNRYLEKPIWLGVRGAEQCLL